MADLDTDLQGLEAIARRPVVPHNTLAQVGAILGGFGVGLGMGNPVLEQFERQRDRELKQQLELIRVRQSAQRLRTEREQLGIDLYRSVLSDPHATEEARTWASEGWLQGLGRLGVPVSSELGPAIAERRVTLSDLEAIATALAQDVPARTILAQYPKLGAREFDAALRMSQNPAFLHANKMPTPDDLKIKALQGQQASVDLLLSRFGLESKSPQATFVLRQALVEYGKPFDQLTSGQQQILVEKSGAMALPLTNLTKQALEEKFGHSDIKDPAEIQKAVNEFRAKRQSESLTRMATLGQLTQMGTAYRTELNRVTQNLDRIKRLDVLADDADRLIKEGRQLGLTDNAKLINLAVQEVTSWTGGPLSKGAAWVRAWSILDARYASVAQALEGITGNRIAQTQVRMALGFHPKATDPYTVQERVLRELRTATRKARDAADEDLARVMRQFQSATQAAGVPFVLGSPGEWFAEPEGEE